MAAGSDYVSFYEHECTPKIRAEILQELLANPNRHVDGEEKPVNRSGAIRACLFYSITH